MTRDGFRPADHERAQELAAIRIDDLLAPADEAWLAEHLEGCPACAAIAAEYDAQHLLLGSLRGALPEPPRDLWARTSAAIEAERARRIPAWRRLRRAPRRATRLTLAPLIAVVAVALVVGTGLLNGRPVVPGVAQATPIAIAGAADLNVLVRDSAGNLQILSRPVDQVCPTGVESCGVSPTFAVTAVNGLGTGSDLQGMISPTGGQMVVVAHDPGAEGVYIVPVKAAATPQPSSTASTTSASPSHPASGSQSASSAVASPTRVVTPSPGTPTPIRPTPASSSPSSSSTATASISPTASAVHPSPVASPTPRGSSQAPSDTPSTSASSPAASSSEPSPSDLPAGSLPAPSVQVTPAPDAAIRIASGVSVVGVPTYSPDGTRVAFSAMPSDASAGPDVYVWSVGDPAALAITTDHDSWLSAWTQDGILVSRVTDGQPSTVFLDPTTGKPTPVGAAGGWLPTISPTGTTAAWWSGTVRLGPDGVTWTPDNGRLVLGAWPGGLGSGPTPQVLAKGPVDGWQVRWDDDGTVVAVWLDPQGNGRSGRLSLYSVDPTTGIADLANPMLDSAPANPDFSLRAGRLAWTAPTQGAPQVVKVLAWTGRSSYQFDLPADGSGTVVP